MGHESESPSPPSPSTPHQPPLPPLLHPDLNPVRGDSSPPPPALHDDHHPHQKNSFLRWVYVFFTGMVGIGSLAMCNLYILLLLIQQSEKKHSEGTVEKDVEWKWRYALITLVLECVLMLFASYGFLRVVFSNPGVVPSTPWRSMPIPGGATADVPEAARWYDEMQRGMRTPPLPLPPHDVSEVNRVWPHDNACSSSSPAPLQEEREEEGGAVQHPLHRSSPPPLSSSGRSVSPVSYESGAGVAEIPPARDDGSFPHASSRSLSTASSALLFSQVHDPLPSFLPCVEDWPSQNKHIVFQREIPREPPRVPMRRTSGGGCGPPLLSPSPPTRTTTSEALRYCHHCQLFKPDNAHHCAVCNRCVYYFDHHCTYVNNCVGRNNYRMFYSFLLYATLCGGDIPLTFIALYRVDDRPWKEKKWWLIPPIVEMLPWLFVCTLFFIHTFFVAFALSSVDNSIRVKTGLAKLPVSTYFHWSHISTRQRRQEYCLNLFGSYGEWWKVLFPTLLRRDDGPDRAVYREENQSA